VAVGNDQPSAEEFGETCIGELPTKELR